MDRRRSMRRSRKYRRPWFKVCKEYIRNFIAFLFSNVGIIGLVLGYTIAGAFIFQRIEKDRLIQVYDDIERSRNVSRGRLWNITLWLNNQARIEKYRDYQGPIQQELKEFQERLVKLISTSGYDGTGDKYGKKQWSFAGGFLYSLTVITTIGYGNIWPHSPQGKMVSIVYAIIGMPLFLLYLSNIGDVMARSFKWIYANFCLCRWCPGVAKRRAERRMRRALQMAVDYSNSEESGSSKSSIESIELGNGQRRDSIISDAMTGYSDESYDIQAVTVPVTICLMIMIGYICGGAILFCNWESWSFLDAAYFCFISLSTIGFGDLVPGDKIYGSENGATLELSFVFCSMYLMLGMALIAMCFNLMQEEVIHKIKTTVRTIKYIFRCR